MYISQALIKRQADFNCGEYGVYDEDLAKLELEDAARKGCLIDHTPYCMNCPHNQSNTCPLNDWQKRHPEFVNDELTKKIERRITKLKAIWRSANKKYF